MSSKPLKLNDSASVLTLALESLEARQGLDPPKGPRPEQDALGSMISLMKEAVERSQAAFSQAKATEDRAAMAKWEAEQTRIQAARREHKEFNTLMMFAREAGYSDKQLQELAHEFDHACDEADCQDCCDHEYDDAEGGYCINCGKHPNE